MKINRKLFTILLSLLLASCVSSPITAGAAEPKAEPIPIDMYLIGGQSNACGYSVHNGQFTEEFKNVGYAGETDKNRRTGIAPQRYLDYNQFRWSVKAGLGSYSVWMGPEYGMAKVFNGLYEGEKKAFIFKSAAGATSIRNLTHDFGNWYPRSKWPEGYIPDGSEPKGFQYYTFIENFKSVYNQLVANGYAPTVRGMAWMQGEADVGYESSYESLIKTLISDIRTDLAEITKDQSLLEMPFVIGKIAVFASYDSKRAVKVFNEMQDRVANSEVNVSTVSTSDLILIDKDGNIKGTDAYHFNGKDMETLGMRFGTELAKGRIAEIESEQNKDSLPSDKGKGSCSGSVNAGIGGALGLGLVGIGASLVNDKKRKK